MQAIKVLATHRMLLFPSHPPTDDEKHVEANLVEIRKSQIPKSGKGVFAKDDIPANRLLGYYRGEALNLDEFNARHEKNGVGIYVLTLPNESFPDKNMYVDGEQKGNWTSRMNSPRGTDKKANVIFYSDGTVVSKRNIKKGEELFVGYGPRYWNSKFWKNTGTRKNKKKVA